MRETIGYSKKFQTALFAREKLAVSDGKILTIGSVAERFKALVLKTSEGETLP